MFMSSSWPEGKGRNGGKESEMSEKKGGKDGRRNKKKRLVEEETNR